MSWSLEVFSPHHLPLSLDEIETHLLAVPPLLQGTVIRPQVTSNATISWQEAVFSEDGVNIAVRVQAMEWDAEHEADPQLHEILQEEIADEDEDDIRDAEYTDHLRQLLASTCWHYSVSVLQNDQPDQRLAAVRVAYALLQKGGLAHDLQSGAWMDAPLFESLLGAYGV